MTYDGPAGSYRGLIFPDLYDGPQPEVWHVQLGGPKACAVSADPAFDGVLLGFFNTPAAIRTSIQQIHRECERIGRDPATLRICVSVNSAPDFHQGAASSAGIFNPSYGSGLVTRDTLKAFLVIFATEPKIASLAMRRNGWDQSIAARIRQHPLFAGMDDLAPDYHFRDRSQLTDVASLVPDSWIDESCAVGSTSECVRKLQGFREAGADEIALYCSTPGQNADVIDAWRQRSAAASSPTSSPVINLVSPTAPGGE